MNRVLVTAPARIIVTTDPELDDLNSMLRLLLYSNEIDIAALVYSSSRFHQSGDADLDIPAKRWPAAGERLHIDEAIDAYALAYDNLVRHDARYPTPESLRAITALGNVIEVGDTREPTAGSDLVRDVLLGAAPGKVFAQAWGGTNTIARALMSIEEEYRGTDRWEEIHDLVSRRTVITSFAQQDDTFAEYIRPTWPEIEFRDVATMAWGYFAWEVVAPDDQRYLSAEWMRENVSEVGPIGAAYRVWGDGRQMAEGFDDEDYFGVPDATAEELSAQGYRLWAPLHPRGSWISEGDTSNFAMHIDNGLRNAEHPTFGGWGGRQELAGDDPHLWTSVGMRPWAPGEPFADAGEVAPWFGAYQRDLAARLQWSVTPDVSAANHPPRVTASGLDRVVDAGERVILEFAVTDPDGDAVSVRGWQDGGPAAALSVAATTCTVEVPADAASGAVIRIIVEATDDGSPVLAGYARFVLTVR